MEQLKITGGSFGPIAGGSGREATALEIAPLTVFLGPQGSGKSLVAQVLYFFRGLPWHVWYHDAHVEPSKANLEPVATVRWILDNLRSAGRGFAAFAGETACLTWEPPFALPADLHTERLYVRLYAKTSGVAVSKALGRVVSAYRRRMEVSPRTTALYVPAERILLSAAKGATSTRVLRLGSTYDGFEQWMHAFVEPMYAGGRLAAPSPEGDWIRRRVRDVLGGEARLWGTRWRWHAKGSNKRFDIDLVSSGQRATWPLVTIAESLFDLRRQGATTEQATLYVEEPEIHLHPEAQRAVIEVLAYLVNSGFRVVLTTHSLTVLYTLNNLVAASRLANIEHKSVPDPRTRMSPEKVRAYRFGRDGTVASLMNSEGLLDERALADVDVDLNGESNRIWLLAAERDRNSATKDRNG